MVEAPTKEALVQLMNKTQDILYNVISTTQSIYWDAPEGRPSAVASMKLYLMGTGDDGTVQDALDAPAVEANPDTTFDANSGKGQADETLCNLTATTGIAVERQYLATNALGETDWVTVQGFTAGVSVNAKNPLKNAYVSGDTFETTRITADFKDAWVQTESNVSDGLDPNPGYRCRVEYTAGGVVRVHHFGVDLVRYTGGASVTPAAMNAFRPRWSYNLPTYHREDDGARIIESAYDDLRWDLFRAGVPDEMIRNQDAIDRGTMLRAWKNLTMENENEEAQTDAADENQAFLDGVFRITAKAAKATDSSGAGATTTVVGLLEK